MPVAAERSHSSAGWATPYSPTTSPVGLRIGVLFDAVCGGRNDLRPLLRDAVTTLVERMKWDGQPPERVVLAVKTAVAKSGIDGWPPSLINTLDGREPTRCDVLYRDVFGWMLAAYFDEASIAPAQRSANDASASP